MLGFGHVTKTQGDMNINVYLFCTGTDLKTFRPSTGHKTSANSKCPNFQLNLQTTKIIRFKTIPTIHFMDMIHSVETVCRVKVHKATSVAV